MYIYNLEYIWVGGNSELRSKTKIHKSDSIVLEKLPDWNYDGSSTGQASGEDSEVIIKPVALYINPLKTNSYFVLCDTWLPNGMPHKTNTRYLAKEIFDKGLEEKPLFGMEQEFFLINPETNLPCGFPNNGFPSPQGQYYCSVGTNNAYCREYLDEVVDILLKMDIPITGANFEVCPGQMEIQICSEGINQGDNLMMARYILHLISEKYNCKVDLSAKPVKGDWNGSGCHINFSTLKMRECDNGYEIITDAISKLEKKHLEHISVYGDDNVDRLTGLHETAHISEFSFGVANRGASIRIPRTTEKNKKGYFEDRRPSSSCDPYLATSKIFETCCL